MDPREEVEEAALEERRGGAEAVGALSGHLGPDCIEAAARNRKLGPGAPPLRGVPGIPPPAGVPNCGEAARECGFCGERPGRGETRCLRFGRLRGRRPGCHPGRRPRIHRHREIRLPTATAPPKTGRSRRAKPKPSCESCYFGVRMLCALELGEPCSTFRPDSPHGPDPADAADAADRRRRGGPRAGARSPPEPRARALAAAVRLRA